MSATAISVGKYRKGGGQNAGPVMVCVPQSDKVSARQQKWRVDVILFRRTWVELFDNSCERFLNARHFPWMKIHRDAEK